MIKRLIVMIILMKVIVGEEFKFGYPNPIKDRIQMVEMYSEEYNIAMIAYTKSSELIVSFPDIYVGRIRKAVIYVNDLIYVELPVDAFEYTEEYAKVKFYVEGSIIDSLLRETSIMTKASYDIVFKDNYNKNIRSISFDVSDRFREVVKNYSLMYK